MSKRADMKMILAKKITAPDTVDQHATRVRLTLLNVAFVVMALIALHSNRDVGTLERTESWDCLMSHHDPEQTHGRCETVLTFRRC